MALNGPITEKHRAVDRSKRQTRLSSKAVARDLLVNRELFGMAVMLIIIYLYYSVSVYPGATVVVPEAKYQYEQEYPIYKREAGFGPEESYVEENDYYNEPVKNDNAGDYEFQRNKRDNQTSAATAATTSSSQAAKTTRLGNSTSAKESDKTPNKGNASSSDSFQGSGEEELDFKLSNSFVDSVQAEADQNRIKQPLGLCRKNIDIATPEMNVTLFPLEQAQEIITCINDILKNQSKKHLCIELNEEMNAFLKWLILTGDSKERRKQIKISAYHDDFLFPSTCGAHVPTYEALTVAPVAAPQQPGGLPVGPLAHTDNRVHSETRVHTETRVQTDTGVHTDTGVPLAAPPHQQDVILTTCAPVLVPGKSASASKKGH